MIYGITLILLTLLTTQEVAPGTDILPSCDAAYVGLFTPATTSAGRYETCVLANVVSKGRITESGLHLAEPELLEPLDAFGAAGNYSRAKLAQLYGGRRVTVVRGWRENGNEFESVTFLSPYPDPTLTSLREGTLIVRWITGRP